MDKSTGCLNKHEKKVRSVPLIMDKGTGCSNKHEYYINISVVNFVKLKSQGLECTGCPDMGI